MYITMEECREAWEKAGKHGSSAERIARNAKWIQYYRYMAKQQEDSEAGFDPHAEEIVRHLFDMGWMHDKDTVLDIGSGTGAYSLAFARSCSEVTALDMDADSLTVLGNHAAQLGVSNISSIQSMWEVYDPSDKFSLTFSSMCPAICTYEDLLKMESITTKTCCLIAVTRGSYDLHRKALMQQLSCRPSGGMTTETLWYYEILYLMGRQPNVRNWTRHYEYDIPVTEACRRNEIYFQIFGIPKEKSQPVLRQYFESRATDGLVHEESQLNTALICWRPL